MEHEWWVKRPVLPLFDKGKELEVRVKARFFEGVRPGDIIIFNGHLRRRVVDIREYSSFDEMLKKEDPNKILPNSSSAIVLQLLRSIYSQEREQRGVYVFELAAAA